MKKVYRKKTAPQPFEVVGYNELLGMILNELHDKDLRTNELLIAVAKVMFKSVEETENGCVKVIL